MTIEAGTRQLTQQTSRSPRISVGQKENEPAQASGGGGAAAAEEDASDVLINTNLLADRNKAFELFRKSYRKNEVIEENKAILKEKYTEAKALGQKVNERKKRISSLKALIEQRRIELLQPTALSRQRIARAVHNRAVSRCCLCASL